MEQDKYLGVSEICPIIYRGQYAAGVHFIGEDKKGDLLYARDIARAVIQINAPLLVFTGGEPLEQNQRLIAILVRFLGEEYNMTSAIETSGNKFSGKLFSEVKYFTLKPRKEDCKEEILQKYFNISAMWQQRKRQEMILEITDLEDMDFANHVITELMGESKIQTYITRKCHKSIFAEGWMKHREAIIKHFTPMYDFPRLVLQE